MDLTRNKTRLGIGLLAILGLMMLPITAALADHRHDHQKPTKPQNPPCDANHSYKSSAPFGKCGKEGPPGAENCTDGVDNDGDGVTDQQDPDCQSPEGPPGDPSCSDGIDNNGNGLTDANDPGCQTTPPPSEGPPGDPTCSDGGDNDGDGRTDQADPDCQEPEGPPGDPTCTDGIDNNGNGLTDAADPGCQTTPPPPASECDDDEALVATILPENADGVEDGSAALDDALASNVIHDTVEELLPDDVLGLNPQNEVHTVNCRVVVPVEDFVDSILAP
jgi:hypothetical protein